MIDKRPVETQDPHDSDRLASEAAFHDAAFTSGVRARLAKFYKVASTSRARYWELARPVRERPRVLEFGCGTGRDSIGLASRGGRVVGIDISSVGVQWARRSAERQGTSAWFGLMNAEELAFADGSFDLVCGAGVLHHLNLDRVIPEIARVLRTGGRGVFIEPLGHNPLLNWYRRRTPDLRTPDERPLRLGDLAALEGAFSEVALEFFHLTALSCVLLHRTPLFRPCLALANRMDRVLLAPSSPLRKAAWMVVLKFAK